MTTVSGNIVLGDYIDVAELRIRAMALAAACGLSRSHQGLVALAVTDVGVFAIQHADRLAVELFVEDEDAAAPYLMVVVRDTDVPATEHKAVSQPSGHDFGLMLAERASERFSVQGEATTGMTVTMGWALKPTVGWVDPGDHLSHLSSQHSLPSPIESLRRETGEVLILLEVLRRAEAAIEEKAEIFMQLTAELDATNRLLGLQPETDPTRDAQAYLETVVHSSPDAMLSMSPDLVVKTWNPGAARLFGYAEAAIIGRHVGVLILEERRGDLDEVARCLMACGAVAPFDTVGRRSDGSIAEVTVAIAAVRDGSGRLIGYSALLRDLTGARKTQDNLFAALDERDRLVEADRLSRNLHDFVARQLSDCASALQSVLSLDPRPELLSRLENVIHKLDTTLTEIRSALTLHHSPCSVGIRAQLLELGSTVTASLGFAPNICFVGAVDDDVSGDLGEHLIAVAREALSNVVRHAHATRVGVVVQVGREAMIEVVDDGRGLGRATRRFGLMSIEARAQAVGGAFNLTSRDGAGTRLEWRAPLRHDHNPGSLLWSRRLVAQP